MLMISRSLSPFQWLKEWTTLVVGYGGLSGLGSYTYEWEALAYFISAFIIASSLFLLFIYLFWLYHMACRIPIPQPGIEPGPWQSVTVQNPDHQATRELLQLIFKCRNILWVVPERVAVSVMGTCDGNCFNSFGVWISSCACGKPINNW